MAETENGSAVFLKGFVPSATSIELLKTLEGAGLNNAILGGGALRDRYLGMDDKINDYDIMADFGSCISLCEPKETFPARMAAYLEQTLGGISDMNISTLSERAGTMAMTLKFKYQGKNISLSINDCGIRLDNAVEGDAPMNAIAMDSRGRVMAHPLFEEHLRKREYHPFPGVTHDRAQARLTHLRQKIPGLH